MDEFLFIELLELSLKEIVNPRFYQTERGYQGELNGLLSQKLKGLGEQSNLISENEYQKKESEHGLKIRPDIIIHEPFNSEYHEERTSGNFIVVELKLNGSLKGVKMDFENIDSMIDELEYKRGVFININSKENFSENYEGVHRDKLNFYAVSLDTDSNAVHIIKS